MTDGEKLKGAIPFFFWSLLFLFLTLSSPSTPKRRCSAGSEIARLYLFFDNTGSAM
jgi:hypothetical protein